MRSGTISNEDNRRYMVVLDLIDNKRNFEIYGHSLNKSMLDGCIRLAKLTYGRNIVDIKICEHSDFILLERT